MNTVPITILSSGVVIFLISLPLIYRKVPMNGIYGIRIPAAFESDQRWYDINAYGGRALAKWSWLIIATGVVGFWMPSRYEAPYNLGSAVLTVVAVLIPVVQVLWWSRKEKR